MGTLILDMVSDAVDDTHPPEFVIHGFAQQRVVIEIATRVDFFDGRWADRRSEKPNRGGGSHMLGDHLVFSNTRELRG